MLRSQKHKRHPNLRWRGEIQRIALLPQVLSGAMEGGGCSHCEQRKSASGLPSLGLQSLQAQPHMKCPTLSSFSLLRVIYFQVLRPAVPGARTGGGTGVKLCPSHCLFPLPGMHFFSPKLLIKWSWWFSQMSCNQKRLQTPQKTPVDFNACQQG